MTNTVPLDDNASQLPEARTTALETHPSWQRHNERRDNVYTDPGLDVMSEGFDRLELTGGFPAPTQAELSPEQVTQALAADRISIASAETGHDAAGTLERGIGQCHHSRYWDGIEREAEDRWANDSPTGYVNPA